MDKLIFTIPSVIKISSISSTSDRRSALFTLTTLFTKLLARHSPGRNGPQRAFQLPAQFKACGSFRNYTRQNHGNNTEIIHKSCQLLTALFYEKHCHSAIHKAAGLTVHSHSTGIIPKMSKEAAVQNALQRRHHGWKGGTME